MASPLATFAWDDWLALAICAIFVVGGVWVMPRVWRDELARGTEERPGWWGWGETLWQGSRRTVPLAPPAFGIVLIMVLSVPFVPEQPTGPFVRPYWAVVPALGALGLVFAVALCVVLVNRPKFIVPPHLRDQPGALAAWLSQWRGWRAKRRSRAERRTRDVRR